MLGNVDQIGQGVGVSRIVSVALLFIPQFDLL
jgi:hypothetical protein